MEGRVLVSVDEEETDAAAPSNDREASLRRGQSPADDQRELTAVQKRGPDPGPVP